MRSRKTERICKTCHRKYCDRKNRFIVGCNKHLAEYRTKVEKPGIRERQFQLVKKLLESNYEISFQDLTALANREIKICRQTVSKLAKDIAQVTGHKQAGQRLIKTYSTNDF